MRELWGDVRLVRPDQMETEIGSTSFFGGIQVANSATLQPALFHFGLAQAALDAGTHLLENRRVTALRRTPNGFEATASGLTLHAKSIILATNAETGLETMQGRRLRRRMTIVPAYALITEPLTPDIIHRVMPRRGSFSDTYTLLHYM